MDEPEINKCVGFLLLYQHHNRFADRHFKELIVTVVLPGGLEDSDLNELKDRQCFLASSRSTMSAKKTPTKTQHSWYPPTPRQHRFNTYVHQTQQC